MSALNFARRPLAAALSGMALVLVAVLALQHFTGVPPAQSSPQGVRGVDFQPAAIEPGEPCPGAVQTTEEEIQKAGNEYWLPDLKLLPELRGVWWCSGTPTFDYSGITFAFEPGWKVDDPQARWAEMAEQWGRGSVGRVLGRPAFLDPISETDPRGEVLVLVEGTLIRVLGDGKTPLDVLTAAVGSIQVGPAG